jgi:hypothetical protein
VFRIRITGRTRLAADVAGALNHPRSRRQEVLARDGRQRLDQRRRAQVVADREFVAEVAAAGSEIGHRFFPGFAAFGFHA